MTPQPVPSDEAGDEWAFEDVGDGMPTPVEVPGGDPG